MEKVLVIGEACRDVFHYGSCERMAPEGPVPVLNVERSESNGGMALNVVANLTALGTKCDWVVNPNWEALTKERYIALHNNHLFLRVDHESGQYERCSLLKETPLSEYPLVLISDYNKGFLSEDDIEYICAKNNNVFMDTKKVLGSWAEKAKVIKINSFEFERTKHTLTPPLQKKLIVTRGPRGSTYRDKVFPAEEVEVKDVSGAGDTFLAALVVKYLSTSSISRSIGFATECATIAVQKKGVSTI